jgi:peptidoglycan/xylan/chitin deacetylase (PgdA/CDA1 family)
MDVIIVCHTEFGFVHNKTIIFDKGVVEGVSQGVPNLVKLADRYNAKITFAVMPEVVEYFPKQISHEIGLHIHPGWMQFEHRDFQWDVGDMYLRKHCKQSKNSTVLRDHSYEEQLEMILAGKELLLTSLGIQPESFVAGRWGINNDTVQALGEIGITHDCSACRGKSDHYDWSRIPRMCMPYHPSRLDYQEKGDLPLLVVPISCMLGNIIMSPEVVPVVGLSWLKACFKEYYRQDLPLFHICLHSPCMTDSYFVDAMDEFISFISGHDEIDFRFASEIQRYREILPKTQIVPYLKSKDTRIFKSFLQYRILRRKS